MTYAPFVDLFENLATPRDGATLLEKVTPKEQQDQRLLLVKHLILLLQPFTMQALFRIYL